MIKIQGLEKLQREFVEAEQAASAIDGDLGAVSFDPESPESIEAAIVAMEQLIDERLGPYASNSLVAPMIEELKSSYRTGILDKAAEARLGGQAADGE